MTEFKQEVFNLADLCARHGLQDVIISPGSRSAPLTLAFVRHPQLKCRTIIDERAAAFVALGLAQQKARPTILICTSGTAALNYAPAVAEAFYQQIPLLVLTADRPPEWIGQDDGQTIQQHRLYGAHTRGYFEFPVDTSHKDACWHAGRIISDAINSCSAPVAGPVHINVPLREPLYPQSAITYTRDARRISRVKTESRIASDEWPELSRVWQQSRRKMIIAGLGMPSDELAVQLSALEGLDDTVIHADVASNCHDSCKLHFADMILSGNIETLAPELQPDLVVSFGGPIISKSMKRFLRKFRPAEHWHLQQDAVAIDTYQSVTRILPVEPAPFFRQLLENSDAPQRPATYASTWAARQEQASTLLDRFLNHSNHSELSAMQATLRHLPQNSNLQLGNSSIVRLASLVSLKETRNIQVNSNRGTSGIDGTVSTTVGAALAVRDRLTTLIVGDLAFFYDRNALWQRDLPGNLRIIVFNNGGGGIFRMLDDSRRLPELQDYFEVEQNLTAERTAADHGLEYRACDAAEQFSEMLSAFFQATDKASLLEVFFDKTTNSATFAEFKSITREIK